MFEEMTEQQAREEILKLTKEYCEKYHNNKKPYEKGDRIPYASRVYDSEEMVNNNKLFTEEDYKYLYETAKHNYVMKQTELD